MHSLQLLFRASAGTLLLVLCLQLGTSKAQEDTTRRAVIMNVQVPKKAEANQEITLKLNLQTELKECLVCKIYLRSNITMDGPFNYVYTSCLCEDYPRNIYWDFRPNRTMAIAAVVDITREENICPNDEAVIPIKANRYYYRTSVVVQ
ncbi:PREDICTED: prolactin-inducible protein [Propithecus coquereli]|uniref:prolactin-inducible protein n=1 Tax=Propithecus coquereli TaxID=379532 RepID=UPI00063F20F2|nr:PREDICTED: prolactin-inducible protein [Propithecus coquereli]